MSPDVTEGLVEASLIVIGIIVGVIVLASLVIMLVVDLRKPN